MRHALKKFHDAARQASTVMDAVREAVVGYQLRADAAARAQAVTAVYERERAAYEGRVQPLNEKLGLKLASKGTKVNELVSKFGNPKGDLAITHFRKMVASLMGSQVLNDGEVDELFASLDEDGGGTLDNTEMRHALQAMVDAGKAKKANEGKAAKKSNDAQEEAQNAQAEIRALLDADEAAAAAEAQRAEEEAIAKAAAAERAALAKAAAAAEKAAAAAAAKAEFDAKVAARRAK